MSHPSQRNLIVCSIIIALVSLGCRSTADVPAAPESTLPPTPTPAPVAPVPTPEPIQIELIEESDPVTEEPDPADVQQEALDLCQSAAEFLDQGDVDDALASLDRAYELMLMLPSNGDESFLQARQDIRRLVADLIVRTYESQQAVAASPATSFDLEIRLVENEHVKREIKSFTNGERQAFLDAYRRSGRYRPMMLAKLEEAGLPSQLSWLPLVESHFKIRALSRASALGLWQFIASTGQRYGLSRDGWVDERMDPEKSTDAAIAYLTDLHDLFGDWPKALAGYNCGEARVQRLQRNASGEYLDFWDLYSRLPRETRRYVPRLYAALLIIENPEKYGMVLPEPDPPLPAWAEVQVDRPVQLSVLDQNLGLPEGTLRDLNPELRHGATPPESYALKVPVGNEATLMATIESIPEWKPPTPATVTHRVRRGETLSGIAARYGTSVGAIMRTNNLRSANRIWPGQRLQVPVRGGSVASAASFNPTSGEHTVRRGESLYSIARQYRTTVDRLKRDNNLSGTTIYPGQKLKVAPGSQSGLRRYVVRSGDTPSGIAKAHRVGLSALLRANGLSSRSTIYPGQVLAIP
jgi:membrane-bound lytic murein transglycosylase D